jgi:murein DD-endopeptidase MepM/ murein hydrolase activator NlpD
MTKIKKLNFKSILAVSVLVSLLYGGISAIGQTAAEDTNPEVVDLNRQIRDKREQAKALQDKQKAYEAALAQKQTERQDLNNQIAILDNHLAKTQIEVDSIKLDMQETDLEIRKKTIEIADKEETIGKQKEHIGSVIRLLYKQGQASSLEILLLHDSFSEFLNQLKYLGDVNGELTQSLRGLSDLKDSLEKDKQNLEIKLAEMEKLKTTYDDKLAKLTSQKEQKTTILAQVMGSEEEYQNLIAAVRLEQTQANADISSFETKVRQKLAEKIEGLVGDGTLRWPVPKNTITAYFHDPDYPFRRSFEHPAIDIRAAQGTNVRAAAAGYVARAKDSGMGYSYIMIVHSDGLATVYGHISKIMVKEDEYVKAGQLIGLSGATPGTPGAGKFTTGPHMHFEVRLNGIPVDPLGYLN